MKQLMYISPGNLEWQDVPEPSLQLPTDALIRPLSVASCDLDGAVIRGVAPVPGPYPFGHEAIGIVEEVGANVAAFRRGDYVAVPFQITCGECERCARGITGSCLAQAPRSAFGLGPFGGLEWGGALSDVIRVPFADNALIGVSPDEGGLASVADNMPDGLRTVSAGLAEFPGAPVLIGGGAGPGSVGLYAAACAVALGASRVDYADTDPRRLEIAESVGAKPIEISGSWPKRFGTYPVTVDHTSNTDALNAIVRSTEPYGICTSSAIYFGPPTAMPLFEMYSVGIRFVTGRVNARAGMPQVLDLVRAGKLHPENVTTETAHWDDAVDALKSYTTKLVISRAA